MKKKKESHRESLEKILDGGISEKELAAILKDRGQKQALKQAAKLVKYLKQCGQQRVKWNNLQTLAGQLASKMYDDFLFKNKPGNEQAGICRYDSGIYPLPDGVRPAAVDTRRLKYALEICDLELSVYPINLETFEVIGQIHGLPDDSEVRVALTAKNRSFETGADKFRLFRFKRIPSGSYRLGLLLNQEEIGFISLEL